MILSEEFMDLYRNINVGMLIFIALADNVVIFIVKQRTPLLDNKYFKWHLRYGFIKTTIIKILGVAFIVSCHLIPVPGGNSSLTIIMLYTYFVVNLIIDFIKRNKKNEYQRL